MDILLVTAFVCLYCMVGYATVMCIAAICRPEKIQTSVAIMIYLIWPAFWVACLIVHLVEKRNEHD